MHLLGCLGRVSGLTLLIEVGARYFELQPSRLARMISPPDSNWQSSSEGRMYDYGRMDKHAGEAQRG